MDLTFTQQAGDVAIPVHVPVNVGDEFTEGTTRYRVARFEHRWAERPAVVCVPVRGEHPFWWHHLVKNGELYLDENTAAKLILEKRVLLVH
jgi:hypothetical protein